MCQLLFAESPNRLSKLQTWHMPKVQKGATQLDFMFCTACNIKCAGHTPISLTAKPMPGKLSTKHSHMLPTTKFRCAKSTRPNTKQNVGTTGNRKQCAGFSINNRKSPVLATVCVKLFNSAGSFIFVRVLFNSGSEVNLITEKCANQAKLPKRKLSIQLEGITGTQWADLGEVCAQISPWFNTPRKSCCLNHS